MPHGSKLSGFERGRICELHKQGLPQCAIAAEIYLSETVISNLLNEPESHGKTQSTISSKKIFPALSRRIKRVVSQDRGQS